MNWFSTPDWKDDDEYDYGINQDYVDQAIRRVINDLDDAARRVQENLDQLRDVAEAAKRYRLTEVDVSAVMSIVDHFSGRARSSIDSAARDVNDCYQRVWDHYLTVR